MVTWDEAEHPRHFMDQHGITDGGMRGRMPLPTCTPEEMERALALLGQVRATAALLGHALVFKHWGAWDFYCNCTRCGRGSSGHLAPDTDAGALNLSALLGSECSPKWDTGRRL